MPFDIRSEHRLAPTEPACSSNSREETTAAPARPVLRLAQGFPCHTVDLSEGGALLEADFRNIPDAFYLVLEGDPKRRTCQVVRRSADYAGVRFV